MDEDGWPRREKNWLRSSRTRMIPVPGGQCSCGEAARAEAQRRTGCAEEPRRHEEPLARQPPPDSRDSHVDPVLAWVAVITKIGIDDNANQQFKMADWIRDDATGQLVSPTIGEVISQGQYLRWITPIFLHFGPMHLLFNMSATLAYGGQSSSAAVRCGSSELCSRSRWSLTSASSRCRARASEGCQAWTSGCSDFCG